MANRSKEKKNIKDVTELAGKYDLKGFGKELSEKESIKMIEPLVRNPAVQKIETSFGRLTPEAKIPSIETNLVSATNLQYLRNPLKGEKMVQEIKDLIEGGNAITQNCCQMMEKVSKESENQIKDFSENNLDPIEDLFR